ncbi:MAG: hypothetical protein L6306_10655 [Planctomycetales bacterium]|nr:hypothetical protein [Planctomycetales bacterium]
MNLDGLKSLDLDALPELFPTAGGDVRNVAIGLDERKHERRATRRRFLNQLQVENAARHLDRLPEPGESFHGTMSGNFHAFAFLPAIIKLAGGAVVAEANICTLGFNQINTLELFDLLDKDDVKKCSFIFSCYYRSNEPEVADALIAGLQARGQRVAVVRNHAKLILAELDDGRCFTWESSANMRSCRNVEQYVLTHDRPLLEFHRAWMNQILVKGNQK